MKVKLPFSCAKLGDLMISEGNLEEGFNACQQTLNAGDQKEGSRPLLIVVFHRRRGQPAESLCRSSFDNDRRYTGFNEAR